MAEHVAALLKGHHAFIAGEQRHDGACGKRRLRAIPEAGDDGAHQCWNISTPDPEGGARENGIGHAGANPGVADKAHQKKDHQRADADRQNEIDEIAAEKEKACGKKIAVEAVNVRCPHVKDTESTPLPLGGRCQIFIV